jgi:RNA 3'-terminal phosphate cyclase (ATP)
MIRIDGSLGEGGGQVLRSGLTLSLLTSTPIEIQNIRARRPKPGLMTQHLFAVQAAAAVGNAQVEGMHLGSTQLSFKPRAIRSGDFRFDLHTAGSTSLVLQTILLPLSYAAAPSSIVLTGGTHVPWSPCFHYLALHWLRYIGEIGFDIELRLEQAGFYPRGGGLVKATTQPIQRPTPIHAAQRGAFKRISGISAVANLNMQVAERQRRRAVNRLKPLCEHVEIEIVRLPSPGRGTMLLLLAEFEHHRCCFYALGARGKPAEQVAEEAVVELEAFLASDGCVDAYLADQLIVPLALAEGVSEIRTSKVTQHLITNVQVVKLFLPVEIAVVEEIGQPGTIRISGASFTPERARAKHQEREA